MNLCIYEDASTHQLFPLAHYQLACDLRCGAFTMRERTGLALPDRPTCLFVRPHMSAVAGERHPDCRINERPEGPTLFVNARALATPGALRDIGQADPDRTFRIGGSIAACVASAASVPLLYDALADGSLDHAIAGFDTGDIDGAMLSFAWDCITLQPTTLRSDLALFPLGEWHTASDFPGVHVAAPAGIFLGAGVTIHPGAVILAQEGPVVIEAGAIILPQAVIMGPAYIGAQSTIKAGAKIYPSTTIGPVCKAGGEIEGSILHSYANKQHEGFLGHSYIGAWTNIGADTNTSDLKNTYGPIRMVLEGREYDTGQRFLGLLMAEHAKCGINTMFNTGTTVGVGANVFGADYPPKFIPSFSWGGAAGLAEYPLRKCAAVARTVMTRRDVAMSGAEERLLQDIFAATADQRSNFRNRQPSRPSHAHV